MSQFDSELEANAARARFDRLAGPGIGSNVAITFFKLFRSILSVDPTSGFDLADMISESVSALREDRDARSTRESTLLLESVVLTLQRHGRNLASIEDRLGILESRLEEGLKLALRFPHDGSRQTIERLALVVVRGAVDFEDKPQEQTSEFLRIAGQITQSELQVLGNIYEFQEGMSRQDAHSSSQANWLSNVMNAWVSMNRKYPPSAEEWMHRKSALVRLESHGFIEREPGNPTAEGGEMGQLPYALLPLGREFCEYIKPLDAND